MFLDDERKAAARDLYRRLFCALFAAMAAGTVLAEDDPIEPDPNGFTVIFDSLKTMWEYLATMIA